MGEKSLFGGTLFLDDGTKLCEVQGIPEFSEITTGSDSQPLPIPLFNTDYEIVEVCNLPPASRKTVRRTLLGWTAKGPLRWRQMRKMLGIISMRR